MQLTKTTDPEGEETTYEYDWLGRVDKETHPDRGVTETTYNLMGNVSSIYMQGNGHTINFEYDRNRLVLKKYPVTANINDIAYTYGVYGDGKNGAGRVVEIKQGASSPTNSPLVVHEQYAYDELGNAITEDKTIAVPLVGEFNFLTEYEYDSWGRVQKIVYPDTEEVTYHYTENGELEQIKSALNFDQTYPYDYVTKIGYDGFGNQKYLLHGNGVLTEFTYSKENRALTDVDIFAPSQQYGSNNEILKKNITYFDNGNVDQINNDRQYPFTYGIGNGLGGDYTSTYTYDFANRLTRADHDWEPNGVLDKQYELMLSYNKAGGITSKTQNDLLTTGHVDPTEYNMSYTYQAGSNGGEGHKIDYLTINGDNYEYVFDGRGNTEHINGPVELQRFVWDEVDRLRGVENNQGIHHYVYDGTGTRLMKGSVVENFVQHDGELISEGFELVPYTVYVNPYMVCTFYDGDVDVSKHYFSGSVRIASKLYNHYWGAPIGGDPQPEPLPGYLQFFQQDPATNNVVLDDLTTMMETQLGQSEYTKQDMVNDGLPESTHYEELPNDYNHCEEWTLYSQPPLTQMMYHDCLCRYEPETAESMGLNCYTYSEIYWYHPDYLGNTEFVTDLNGIPYQAFYYTAFGESLVSQHANTGYYSTPYRFNAKELDPETGLYYYGARYYNPQTSIWLSIDPLASMYPHLTPYNFVENNPIMLIDPTGMSSEEPGGPGGPEKKTSIINVNSVGPISPATGNTTSTSTGTTSTGSARTSSTGSPMMAGRENFLLSTSRPYNTSSTGHKRSGVGYGAMAGLFSGMLSNQLYDKIGGTWTGKNLKVYSTNWWGNDSTGGKLKFAKSASNLMTGIGWGIGLYNMYSIDQQYRNGSISGLQRDIEQSSNVISTLGGIYGATWGIGWELGRVITNLPGYHENVRLPLRKKLGLDNCLICPVLDKK